MRNVFKHPKNQQQFETDGYVILDMLSLTEIEILNALFKNIEADLIQMPFATSTMASDEELKSKVSTTLEKAFSKRMKEVFDKYRWFFGSFIYKYPSREGNQGEVSMHQDTSFVDESKFHGINIFCSLGYADEVSGTLQVVPGSHLLNQNPRGFGQPFPYQEYQQELFSKGKRIDLNPGQAIIYTTKLFHYSEPNRSDKPRIIAAGVVGPEESELQYYHIDRTNATAIEVFDVDANYYLKAPFFSRPDTAIYPLKEELEVYYEPLTEHLIESQLKVS